MANAGVADGAITRILTELATTKAALHLACKSHANWSVEAGKLLAQSDPTGKSIGPRKTANGTCWIPFGYKTEKGSHESNSITVGRRGLKVLLAMAADGTLAKLDTEWDSIPLSASTHKARPPAPQGSGGPQKPKPPPIHVGLETSSHMDQK
jgi:hypothetical protein